MSSVIDLSGQRFGKLTAIYPPTKYSPAYAAKRAIIARAYDSGKIVIATNKLKDEYESKQLRDPNASGRPAKLSLKPGWNVIPAWVFTGVLYIKLVGPSGRVRVLLKRAAT